MHLKFNTNLINHYKNSSQKIRVMSEDWVKNHIFCPICGNTMREYPNNKQVADFQCLACKEDYELKSKKSSMGRKVIDGSYHSMIERLRSASNPNFFFLNYNITYEISNFIVIPKYFFTSKIIEKRKPLSSTAKRANWIGCNILLNKIPNSGKVFYIKDKKIINKENVMKAWQKITFLKNSNDLSKGWTFDIMQCIDKLNKLEFSLQDLYTFERSLSIKYPNNSHIKDKIRQQLQFLRNNDFLSFVKRGIYRLR